MTEQNAGGYQFDVSDDIAGNPAVKMVDDCHCSDIKPMGDQTNELVGGYQFDVSDDIAGNPAVVANDVRDCDNNAMMKTQQDAGGYQFDVSDDIAGNPAVKMVDDCHCSDVKPMGDQTNELVGGGNPYDFLIEPTGKNLIFLQKMVEIY